MLSNIIRRQPPKSNRTNCPQSLRQRKIVLCDWGIHGRGGNGGWTFTYVDDVDFDAEEDLRSYPKVYPDSCGETISNFALTQLRKNSRVKRSKGWFVCPTCGMWKSCSKANSAAKRRFVCVIEDGQKRVLPLQRRDRTPRTMLLFERDVPCPCEGRESHSVYHSKRCEAEEVGDVKHSETISEDGALPPPPPQYRSRMSTLSTLHEDDVIHVMPKER